MEESQIREFSEPGVLASVLLGGGKDWLKVDEQGTLDVPLHVKPESFHLAVATEELGRTVVVQKNVGQEGGSYSSRSLSVLPDFADGFKAVIMHNPIQVTRAGKVQQNVWTVWHNDNPNRIDCWKLDKDGKLGLFQVGVFTHDDGSTWKLHGEYRWKGQLFDDRGALVGLPEHPKWGSLEGGSSQRTQVFKRPEFAVLFRDADIPNWQGNNEDLNPQLPQVPDPKHAVLQWYITFAGQTGQGPCNLHPQAGKTAWIHGANIVGLQPDPDGEIRLWQGDVVSYEGTIENWGAKKNSPPKLTGVRLVQRSW